jgi:hypothetical protein
VTASELWSRNRETSSTLSPASRLSLAALCRRMWSWPFDTSMAMLRLAFSGVFANYPGLKIVAHHQGGLIPTWWPRAYDMMQYFIKSTPGFAGPAIGKDLWEQHMKSFYVDTAVRP